MSDEYEVGYGKPPKNSRFRKGQSGNPKGRPKGRRNNKTEIIEMLEAPVIIRENGKRKTVTSFRAMLFRLLEMALAGNTRAMAMALELHRQRDDSDALGTEQTAIAAEDQQLIDDFIARRQGGEHD